MSDILHDDLVIHAVRDRLVEQLAILDKLGENLAAIELNSAIEILNHRMRDPISNASIDQFEQDFFGD